jgi:predicted AlkP superfamily pyrophosphatase or phosphodiesterase
MNQLVVIEIPGLTRAMVERSAPRLKALADGGVLTTVQPVFPAVTMPVHASLMTGLSPAGHGVVANGWYHRDHNEVMMWRQSERLVKGEKVWEAGKARNPAFTCFKHFWWPGMASTADISINVRPAYHADGRKSPDIYTNRNGLAADIQKRLGMFPLFKFWGPATSIESSEWIANSAKYVFDKETPTLSLVYLTHLDYNQQTLGPSDPRIEADVAEIDRVAGDLVDHVTKAGAQVLVISGYHINTVDTPIHLNRLFREAGWLKIIRNATGELIDFGTSKVFAVADHQVAHIYVQDPSLTAEVQAAVEGVEGVARVLDEQPGAGIAAAGAGDLVAVAKKNAWFTYYYWLDDAEAPDFARTVAIHATPGYDPCEMLLDPTLSAPTARIVGKVLKKKLGFRYVMNVIPLDASLIKGSHGLLPDDDDEAPVLISSTPSASLSEDALPMTAVKRLMLDLIFA